MMAVRFEIRRAVAALVVSAMAIVTATSASAQPTAKPESAGKPESAANAATGYALVIDGDIDPEFAPIVGRLAALYYESYPKLVARFEHPERPAPRKIRLTFQLGLKVPAHCSGDVITVSVDWLRRNPNDLGLLTHELTHAVQRYPSPNPGWFTEGLADYARAIYGPKQQPGWSLPTKLTDKQSYSNGYTTSAKFLTWLDTKHPGSVDKLHRKMQEKTMTLDDFKTLTGKTVDELWTECVRESR